ncbi:hypothetical protein [Hymenobacter ruber]
MATSYLDDFGDDAFEEITTQGVKTKPNDSIPSLSDHHHFKPVFGLDYISFSQSGFCFNNPSVPALDFIELLRCCQTISQFTYGELRDVSVGNAYHFHEVDRWRLVQHGLIEKFQAKLSGRTKGLPPVYQFALYTDSSRGSAPRVLGYVGKWGIFYLLWFDWLHALYPRAAPAAPVTPPPANTSVTPVPLVTNSPADSPSAFRADGKAKRPRLPKPDSNN